MNGLENKSKIHLIRLGKKKKEAENERKKKHENLYNLCEELQNS